MPWWGYLLTGVGSSIVLGFWGWVALSIVQFHLRAAVLENRMGSMEEHCEHRSKMIARMAEKLDRVAEDVARIVGLLNGKSKE